MKYRDLINQIVREDMPDLEKVREACHRQTVPQRQQLKGLRWSTAVAAVAASFILATAVYAASVFIGRLDTGGSMAYTPVPYDSPQYQEQRASWFFSKPVYVSSRAEILPGYVHYIPYEQFEFDSETAQLINEALAGRIFTADGTPFVLMAAIPNRDVYRADDRGNVLYNAEGYTIDMINTTVTFDGEFTAFDCDGYLWMEILTTADLKRRIAFSATYEDALAFLGQNFRLPTVHIEGFYPPVFQLNEIETIRRVDIRYAGREAVYKGLLLSVETIRDESTAPFHFYIVGEITEFEIAGVTIHQITRSSPYSQSHTFWWIHDDLVYSLIPSETFTARQIEEIIRSIIN